MENRLAPVALPTPTGVALSPATPPPQSPQVAMQEDPADFRLVIEEDPGSGLFIYKTVDRRTGDVVQQLPREEVVRMHQTEDYIAGALIRTKA